MPPTHTTASTSSSSSSSIGITTTSGAPPETVGEINRRILESGDLSKLEAHLLQLLQEAGWTERLRTLCQARLRDPEARVANYEDLRRAVDQDAREMVPEHVRVEMVKQVLKVLRGMVESE